MGLILNMLEPQAATPGTANTAAEPDS